MSDTMQRKLPKLVLVLTALLFCYGFLMGGQQLVLMTVCGQFGLGVLGMGTLVAVLHVASTLAPAVLGAAADRIGKKKVLVIFAIVFGIGCLIGALSGFLAMFVIALLMIGAGYSVCESLASAVCVEVDAQNGARYINLTQCLLSVGAILGPIVLSNLPALPFASWRMLYLLCGIPLIVIGIWLSQLPFPAAERAAAEKTSAGRLWLSPVFIAMIVCMFLYIGLESGFGYFVDILFSGKVSGAALGAYGISGYWAGMAFSRLIYSLRTYRPRRTVQLSFLAAAVGFIALILAPSGYLCIGLCALVGFTYGPIWTTIVASAAQRFPQHKASATGLMSASCGLAGILYPVIMGAIVDTLDIRIGFILLALSAVLGAALAFSLNNNK